MAIRPAQDPATTIFSSRAADCFTTITTRQALTDRHGDVLAQYYRDVFGQPWAGPLGAYNAYALTGKEYDAKTGLYYFGARWYDPQVGRWMTQDPARDGLNWYAYVGNSPTAYVDFWGLFKITETHPSSLVRGVIEEGDTLSEIVYDHYGDPSLAKLVAELNGIEDPDLLRVGDTLALYPEVTGRLNEVLEEAGSRASTETLGRYRWMYDNFRGGAAYDLKKQAEWQADYFFFDGDIIDFDAPGNIVYGYAGLATGIPEVDLKAAAGAYQVISGTAEWKWWCSYFDDPRDQEAIEKGMELYRERH